MKNEEQLQPLVRLYETGRRFDFLLAAHREMARRSEARVLSPLVLRALVEAGLGGPARELLQLCPELRPDSAAGRELEERLATLPAGRVEWRDLHQTFASNLDRLRRNHSALHDPVLAATDQLRKTQLYRALDGALYLARRQAGRFREWIGELTPRASDAEVQLPRRGQLSATAVIGLRTEGLIARIHADTARVFMNLSHPLYLFELDALRLAAWLHVADHTALLDDPRVYLFPGEKGVADFERLLTRESGLLPPALFVNQSGDAAFAQQVHDATKRACQARRTELDELTETLKARYRDRDVAYWAKRWRQPGTVLGITSRHTTVLQHSMRDTMDAFRHLGWRTKLLIEPCDHSQYSPLEVCRQILDTDPDLLILLDHLRYENPHFPKNLPMLTWIQDPLANLLRPEAGDSLGPLDFVCGYYKKRCVEEFHYAPERFLSTVFPISTGMFHDGPATPDDEARYTCDVSFVSNASAPLEAFKAEAQAQYPAPWRAMLEELYHRIVAHIDAGDYLRFDVDLPPLVNAVVDASHFNLDAPARELITTQYAYRLYDWGRRQQSLHWVAKWAHSTGRDFRIYGRGWERHPTLGEFAGGVLEHGEPLRCAYRFSKIVLQLIPTGFRHQRSFELLASGTLPLTRYCGTDFMGLPVEEFVRRRAAGRPLDWASGMFPHLERVVFDSPEEFAIQAEQYLQNEPLRQDVIRDLRAVVLREHTYDTVLANVTRFIREYLTVASTANHSGRARAIPATAVRG